MFYPGPERPHTATHGPATLYDNCGTVVTKVPGPWVAVCGRSGTGSIVLLTFAIPRKTPERRSMLQMV